MQFLQVLESLERILSRFRHPVSLPEDMAKDLGLSLSNLMTIEELIIALSHPALRPSKLRKWMPRPEAESAFKGHVKKEIFRSSSLYSYYFNKGWVVIALYFDEAQRLRRIHLQGPACEVEQGFDLTLLEDYLTNSVLN